MKVENVNQLRETMAAVIDCVYAPDSLPGKLLHARKENNSGKWSAEDDRERFEENLDVFLEANDQALQLLVERSK